MVGTLFVLLQTVCGRGVSGYDETDVKVNGYKWRWRGVHIDADVLISKGLQLSRSFEDVLPSHFALCALVGGRLEPIPIEDFEETEQVQYCPTCFRWKPVSYFDIRSDGTPFKTRCRRCQQELDAGCLTSARITLGEYHASE